VTATGKALIDKLATDRAAILYAHLCYLANWVNTPEPVVTDSERKMFAQLHASTFEWKASADTLLRSDLASFNAGLAKDNLDPVVPANTLSPPGAAEQAPPRQENDDDD
jgi:hypothetical protein